MKSLQSDYSLFRPLMRNGLLVRESWGRRAFSICFFIFLYLSLPLSLSLFFSLRSEWLPVCQAGSRTICSWHKSLQGATRSDWESLGGRKREIRDGWRGPTRTLAAAASSYWCVWTRPLIFMPSKHTLKWFFNKRSTLMHSLSARAIMTPSVLSVSLFLSACFRSFLLIFLPSCLCHFLSFPVLPPSYPPCAPTHPSLPATVTWLLLLSEAPNRV